MKKQAFEGTFFNMLEVHRQNVSNIMVDGAVSSEAFYKLVTILEGRYKAAEKSLVCGSSEYPEFQRKVSVCKDA